MDCRRSAQLRASALPLGGREGVARARRRLGLKLPAQLPHLVERVAELPEDLECLLPVQCRREDREHGDRASPALDELPTGTVYMCLLRPAEESPESPPGDPSGSLSGEALADPAVWSTSTLLNATSLHKHTSMNVRSPTPSWKTSMRRRF
jgi:hypothetical protein